MKTSKTHQKRMQELEENFQFNSLKSNVNRARSITVGTAFGGVVEISLRTDTNVFFAQLQPTEAVEIIEQLASACGLQIAMRPKQDFSAWRDWGDGETDIKVIWKGGSPWQLAHADDMIKENLLESKEESNEESKEESVEESNE